MAKVSGFQAAGAGALAFVGAAGVCAGSSVSAAATRDRETDLDMTRSVPPFLVDEAAARPRPTGGGAALILVLATALGAGCPCKPCVQSTRPGFVDPEIVRLTPKQRAEDLAFLTALLALRGARLALSFIPILGLGHLQLVQLLTHLLRPTALPALAVARVLA